MGMMYFPGEKVKEYLPPRSNKGDIVGRFGAWLTGRGALFAYYVTFFFLAACVAVKLILWITKCFNNNVFYGVLSIVGAWLIGVVCIYILIAIALAIAAIVWVSGWAFYNKWTLIACLVSLSLWYCLSPEGAAFMDGILSWLQSFPLVAWEWYRNVL